MSIHATRGALGARAAVPLVVAIALAGCGESSEDQARTQVCDARASISQEVQSLQGLTPATVTADAVRGSVSAIRDDLRTIADAQEDLGQDRREEIKSATQDFTAEIRAVGATVLRSTSADEARTQVRSAVDQLGSSYRSTLGTVDCG